jgi:hypothetical protein
MARRLERAAGSAQGAKVCRRYWLDAPIDTRRPAGEHNNENISGFEIVLPCPHDPRVLAA